MKMAGDDHLDTTSPNNTTAAATISNNITISAIGAQGVMGRPVRPLTVQGEQYKGRRG
jgi:hypothetical protein